MAGFLNEQSVVHAILSTIEQAAMDADAKALEACRKSKYSIQDYWMCIEFWTQRMHDDIARQFGVDRRCAVGPFRARLSGFKKSLEQDPQAEEMN